MRTVNQLQPGLAHTTQTVTVPSWKKGVLLLRDSAQAKMEGPAQLPRHSSSPKLSPALAHSCTLPTSLGCQSKRYLPLQLQKRQIGVGENTQLLPVVDAAVRSKGKTAQDASQTACLSCCNGHSCQAVIQHQLMFRLLTMLEAQMALQWWQAAG